MITQIDRQDSLDAPRGVTSTPSIRMAVVITHPIQHFAPLHREIAALGGVELKVFFCTDWGVQTSFDRDFGISYKWDIPLLDGYASEFLPGKENVRWLGFTGWDNPSIASALEGFQPDVVQVYGYSHRTMWRAVNWCHRRKVPVLLHSDSNASAQRSIPRRLAKSLIVGWFYRRLDGAFSVGDNNYAYHLRYGLSPDRLFPSALPIDVRRLVNSVGDVPLARREIRALHGIPEDAFVAVFSGKLSARKSPMHLLSAIRLCARRKVDVWALFVGEGSERPRMEEEIRGFGIRNAVLAGFVNQGSIGRYYAASDVLVIPSAYDPHPLVVPEAGCFGLPVIASDRIGCIGPSDTARIGANAFAFRYGDVEEIANCLIQLSNDIELYRAMSRSAREIASTQDILPTAIKEKEAATKLIAMGCCL